MNELSLEHISLTQLTAAAQDLIQFGSSTSLWCFEGEMGSGKTTLIQSVCASLGVKDEVTSPTFSLVNEYQSASGNPIYHFDFYRIRNLEEVFDIGYEDYFYSGHLCLIEWPSLIEPLLEQETTLRIQLTKTSEAERSINAVIRS